MTSRANLDTGSMDLKVKLVRLLGGRADYQAAYKTLLPFLRIFTTLLSISNPFISLPFLAADCCQPDVVKMQQKNPS